MKILVTGGAGFIGSNFVRLVLQKGLSCVVLDDLTYAGNPATLDDVRDSPLFSFVKGDITDGDLVGKTIRGYTPDAVVHFAAETHVDRSIDHPSQFLRTNVMGTFELLEACRNEKNLPKDFRFVMVSTDEVFGTLGSRGYFTETSPYAPNSPYSASKASADLLARAYFQTYGFPVIITNCSNNYGPFQFPEKLIPLMVLNALEGKDLPVYGDGQQIRDWIYVEDHCQGVWTALEHGKLGLQYLFGGRSERTNLQVLEAILSAVEELRPANANAALKARGFTDYKQLIKYVKDRPGHDRRYAIDPSFSESQLGWKPGHKFEDGIRETVRWYLGHSDWCQTVQKDNYNRGRLGLGKSKEIRS